jgi:hypothetical protein
MPDDSNWIYSIAEHERPEGFEVFRQPGGLTEGAENKSNLPAGYYEKIRAGKTSEWIQVYVVLNKVRRQRGSGSRIAHGVETPWFDPDTGPTHSSRRRDPIPGERGYRGRWR